MSLVSKIQSHWAFNEGAGLSSEDDFGTNDAALTDATLWSQNGKIDGCISNDGTSTRYVELTDLAFPAAGAISFWLSTESSNRQSVMGFRGNVSYLRCAVNYRPGLGGSTAGVIGFQRQDANGGAAHSLYADVGSSLYDGSFHHIAINFDTQGATPPKVFFDGVQRVVTTPGTATFGGQTFDAAIGAVVSGSTPSNILDGSIDAMMLFDDLLTDEEVGQLYNYGMGRELIGDTKTYSAYALIGGRLRRIS